MKCIDWMITSTCHFKHKTPHQLHATKVLVCVMDLPEREVRACFEEFDVDNKGMKRKRDEREGGSMYVCPHQQTTQTPANRLLEW